MKRVKSGLAASGFETDRQNLVPHLTLGRIKMLQDKILFQRIIERYKDLLSKDEMAGKMILFESILKPSGPVYIVQQVFPFKHQSP
jgi:2'-5' RNA ligase